ncbi:Fe-S protein assembly co-chaperone HscB [Sulfurirhabdus autotrophica]|uniref:Co-chaperone protein HscB homolog n=1 Tax=Sulfurirhabdus autotrophica TaxID=1706046 RepID=A0A4R3YEY8_9PROT|nr:Fe-S protein assembly co-chaperone HscB [Sulfurirhabdus autotrophica]TCV90747.1 co-chaperone protein HscB [Sulfurirhabdus autotrophica]
MKYDFNKNFFELFGFQPAFKLDLNQLDQIYRDIQSQVHPDKFAHLGDAERRLSMQWATLTNEAYQTLKKPINRARYLLNLHQVDTQEETNTAMPAAFLMEQMELREAVMDAKMAHDINALEQTESSLKAEIKSLHGVLEKQLDVEADYPGAAQNVRKLRFLEKLISEINDAYETMDS